MPTPVENREHFRAYAHGLVARVVRAGAVSAKSGVRAALQAVVAEFYKDVVADAAWVAGEIARALGVSGAMAAAIVGSRALDRVGAEAAAQGDQLAQVGARVGKAALTALSGVLVEALSRR